MNIIPRRNRQSKSSPRHTFAAVRAAQSAAQDEPAAPPEVPAEYSLDYDHPGWGGDETHDVTSPGFLPAPDPHADDTMVWRIPSLDGGPGLVLPPATLATEDSLPVRTPGEAIPPALVPALRTEAADPAMLGKVADALRPIPDEPEPPCGAWLRVIVPGAANPWDALPGRPSFAGVQPGLDGTPQAGLYLGEADSAGRFVLDVKDPTWLHELIGAAYEALDAIGSAGSGEGAEAA